MSIVNTHAQCTDCETTCTANPDATGDCSFATGDGAVASGDNSAAIGSGATSSGIEAFALGASAGASGVNSVAIGNGASADGVFSHSIGNGTADGDNSFAIGIRPFAYGDNSFAIGENVESHTSYSYNYIFGRGAGVNYMVNNISNSIMFGMNSTLPTLFIEGASGSGTWGKVGIGTTDPDGILHLLEEDGTDTDLVIERGTGSDEGRLVFHDEGGTERAYIAYDAAEDLMIKNTDQDEDIIFNINFGGADTEVMRIDGSERNVGIGDATPNAKFHVDADPDGSEEQIARFTVGDASFEESLIIKNRTTDAGNFAPWLEGNTDDDSYPALELSGRVNFSGANTGSVPVMVFDARYSTEATALVRPLFRWRSNTQTSLMQMDANGNLGIGTATPGALLHVNGNIRGAGNINPTANNSFDLGSNSGPLGWRDIYSNNGVTIVSDERLKENIEPLNYGLNELLQLNPVKYDLIPEIDTLGNEIPSSGEIPLFGLIAQETQNIIPEIVNVGNDSMHYMGIRYTAIIPILINAIKEQNSLITELQQTVNNCCIYSGDINNSSYKNDNTGIEAVDEIQYILLQNDPNPFKESTTISYEIPYYVVKAELIIFNNEGRIIRKYAIPERGLGKVTFFASNLSSGVYNYSLLLDNNSVVSKKMVITN